MPKEKRKLKNEIGIPIMSQYIKIFFASKRGIDEFDITICSNDPSLKSSKKISSVASIIDNNIEIHNKE